MPGQIFIIKKGQSCGASAAWKEQMFIPVLLAKACPNTIHHDKENEFFTAELNFPELERSFAFIKNPVFFIVHKNELFNFRVTPDRFPDIVNLASFIYFFTIRNEYNVALVFFSWDKIDELPKRIYPDTMKLSLDENIFPYAYAPSELPVPTVRLHVLKNDVEAMINRLIAYRFNTNDNRRLA